MKKAMVFYGGMWLGACSLTSTFLAQVWRYPAAFGGWDVLGWRVYLPGQFLTWYSVTHPGDWWAIHAAGLLCLAFGMLCAWKVWRAADEGSAHVHGQGRLQETNDDLTKSGLL